MEYINNFRYGEISRKLAGSFDKEAYQQGCFTYRNMLTDSFGTATRRPPLRKIISTTGILDIREFKLSESVQYLVGLKEKKYVIFRYVLGELTEITEGDYPHRIDEPEIALTSTMAREIRSAQYYERMYFVHHSFRPFYIEIVPSTDTANSSYMEVLINQDAKGTYFFTPSYVTDAFGKELTNLEGRLVYKKEDAEGNVTWWFDYEMKEEQYEYALTYPPVQGQSSQISYYEDYPDDNLMLGEGNFPSVIAIINDSMYLAATDKCPSTMWKSRILGSSQYIEEYTVESLHDFIQFQLMATETQSMVDADKLPKTEMKDSYGEVLYEEGIYGEKYFVPEKDSDGNYTYKTELFWKPDDVNSETGTYYYERSGDQFSKPYDEDKYGAPIKKPLMTYDLSNIDAIIETETKVSIVGTATTAVRFSFNTGRNDRVMFITPALSKIIVGTTTSEHVLPSNFSATNMTQDNFTRYGSYENYMIEPCAANNSMFFIQKGGRLIEFYNYEGFMYSQDVSYLNHEILKGSVVQIAYKNYPTPMLYIVFEDGTVKTLTYDKNNGIQAFSRWDFPNRKIISFTNYLKNTDEVVLALVEDDDGTQFIGYLDESESESFYDEGEVNYISEIETTYAEIVTGRNGQYLGFGSFKKANRAYIRPYKSGHIRIGDDKEQLVKSNFVLGNDDYAYTLIGRARSQYSIFIQSVDDEPMTILAFAFEVLDG